MLSERLKDTNNIFNIPNTSKDWRDREGKPFQEYAEQFMDDLFADVEQLLSLNSGLDSANLSQPPASGRFSKIGNQGFNASSAEESSKQASGKVQWLDLPGADKFNQAATTQTTEKFQANSHSAKESVTSVDAQIIPASFNGSSSLTLTKLDLPTLMIPEVIPNLEIWMPPVQPITPEISVADDSNWFERVLWLLLGLSLGVATLAWLYSAKLIEINPGVDLAKTSDVAPSANLPATDLREIQGFAQKTRQNLANLNIKQASVPTSPVNNSIPPVPLASQNPFVLPVQPIYVPVYQPPASLPRALTPAPVAPTPLPPRQALPAPAPNLPSPIARVNPDPVIPSVEQKPVTAKPILPLATINSQSKFKLVGILAFGEQSAAMVEVNGAFQTIKLGNPIGDSGWLLSGLNQQEAILKRNGETRSITVGQKF
jgi:hypothetical protein